MSTGADLVDALFLEAFQTEESARAHPAREAKRLGAVPPAAAMLAISRHAESSLKRLRELAAARGKKTAAKAGMGIGQLFSIVRTFAADHLLSNERSYRLTVVGVHHGLGVFLMLRDAALANGDEELAEYCAWLLRERRPLCGVAEAALVWFAQHPELALQKR